MDLGYANYFQFFLALILVLGLIGLVAAVLRHYGLGGAIKFGQKRRDGRRRIEVVDVAPVDARRRLILIRRDNTEHLVLLGAHEDLLVESGIEPPVDELTPDTESSSPSAKFKSLVTMSRGGSK